MNFYCGISGTDRGAASPRGTRRKKQNSPVNVTTTVVRGPRRKNFLKFSHCQIIAPTFRNTIMYFGYKKKRYQFSSVMREAGKGHPQHMNEGLKTLWAFKRRSMEGHCTVLHLTHSVYISSSTLTSHSRIRSALPLPQHTGRHMSNTCTSSRQDRKVNTGSILVSIASQT